MRFIKPLFFVSLLLLTATVFAQTGKSAYQKEFSEKK
jgi:hypothetical protein